jgi:hypothetical protein
VEDGMGKKPLNIISIGMKLKEEDKVCQMPLEKTMMEKFETSKNIRREKKKNSIEEKIPLKLLEKNIF